MELRYNYNLEERDGINISNVSNLANLSNADEMDLLCYSRVGNPEGSQTTCMENAGSGIWEENLSKPVQTESNLGKLDQSGQDLSCEKKEKRVKLDFTLIGLQKLIKEVYEDDKQNFNTESFIRTGKINKVDWEKNANTFYSSITNPNRKAELKKIFAEVKAKRKKPEGMSNEDFDQMFTIPDNIKKYDLFLKTITILCPEEAKDFNSGKLDFTLIGLQKLIKEVYEDDKQNFNTESFQRQGKINKADWEKNAKNFYNSITNPARKAELKKIFAEVREQWKEEGKEVNEELFTIPDNIKKNDLFLKTITILCPEEAKDFIFDGVVELDFTLIGLQKLILKVYEDDKQNFNTESFQRQGKINKADWEKNANTFYSSITNPARKAELKKIFAEVKEEWDAKNVYYEHGLFDVTDKINRSDLIKKAIKILTPEVYPSFKYNHLIAPMRGFMVQYAWECVLKVIGSGLGEKLKIEPKVGQKKPDMVYYNAQKQIEIMFDVKLQTFNAKNSGDLVNYPPLLSKHGNPNIKKHLVFLCLNGGIAKTEYDHDKNIKISYIHIPKLLKDLMGDKESGWKPKAYLLEFLQIGELDENQKLILGRINGFLLKMKKMISENNHTIEIKDEDFAQLKDVHAKAQLDLRKLAREKSVGDISLSKIWEEWGGEDSPATPVSLSCMAGGRSNK